MIEVFFDDCLWFSESPEVHQYVGIWLRDQLEADLFSRVANLLWSIFKEAAPNAPDVVLMKDPRWPTLVAAAREAYDLMVANDAADPGFESPVFDESIRHMEEGWKKHLENG